MARNRPIKILWYGSETDDEGNPIIPKISPSFEKRLEGLNEGEIYIHNDDNNPSIYIRTNKDRVVAISGGANISELAKYFLRKDKEDSTNFLLSLLGGTRAVTGSWTAHRRWPAGSICRSCSSAQRWCPSASHSRSECPRE